MRILMLSMLAGVLALGAVAQEGKFTLTGTVKGQGRKVPYYVTDAWGGAIVDDKATVTDDKVDFAFDLDKVGWLVAYNYAGVLYQVPVIPGEAVTIEGETGNYRLGGSDLYREYTELMSVINPLLEAIRKYDFKQACRDEIAGMSTEEVYDLYQSKLRDNYQPVIDAALSFISEHPDHESSMLALQHLQRAEDLEQAAGIISEEVLKGRMNPYYEAKMENVKRYASNPLLNKKAPDFKLKDINGKKLALSKLRGKWVLLDFWSTTCGNSVVQLPLLKNMYSKYQDRLEILGVDCEDDEAEWMAAVNDTYKLPWLNVLGSYEDPKDPFNLYHITGTPTYFLIAPSGKVAMQTYSLEELFYVLRLLFE